MKRLNKKITTLLLAGVCAASLCVATVGVVSSAVEASATATYKISDVFATNGKLGTDKVSFELANGQNARIKRDLALKWYNEGSVKYLTMGFSFDTMDFNSVTFEMESATSVANEDEKAVNAVEFSSDGTAKVINGVGDTATKGEAKAVGVTAGGSNTLKLAEGSAFDSFKVFVNDVELGEFKNVGANYADYSFEKMHPLEIQAQTVADKKVVVTMNDINGQSFAVENIVDSKIKDTAAPVLVVNEELSSFQYGTAFSLAYEKIDVLQSSGLTESKKYYQWNPTDENVVLENILNTSTYFMDTVYYVNQNGDTSATAKEGYKATSVREQDADGYEYVAIEVTLSDDGNKSETYDLSWYAMNAVTKGERKYIIIDDNAEGAQYKILTAKADKTNEKSSDYDSVCNTYSGLLEDAAKGISAGSDSKITIPDVEKLMGDNGGYRGLKFTISYKTPSSSSPKTASGLSYNGLRFTVTEEGHYEFKIFANDKAGNTMKYYLDGELVDVTTSNVWDIEEIPSFEFDIADEPIKVEEPTSDSSKKTEKILDQTYSLTGLKVVGTTSEKSEYKLYRIDTATSGITEKALTAVKYADITVGKNAMPEDYSDYHTWYLNLYAEKVAASLNVEKAKVLSAFTEIKEYNADIPETADEWEEYNKFNWNKNSKSFTTAEEGSYLILGDFWEDGLGNERAAAYKIVVVSSKADVIKGESKFEQWVENNVVSVILFAVAGVMLIAIIVLLFVKPSDETLEEVEAKAAKKAEKKAKKAKKTAPAEEAPAETEATDEEKGE